MNLARTPAAASSANTTPARPQVSVVVIGRNEGERLLRCLASIAAADWGDLACQTIYVDSNSRDDSVVHAAAAGATVLVLDDASPCAAKARNLGWRHAQGELIFFLDGDTVLEPRFVGRALQALQDSTVCAAWGHRREIDPQQSIYTRVLDLDWIYPTGRSLYFGGDVLIRRSALQAAGGFDPGLKAGEEPELCARLRAAGWQIEHIDAPMTGHDLAIRTLRAYCRRAYRSGMAYAEVAHRLRGSGDPLWQREAARDLRHGLFFLIAPVLWLATLLASPWAAGGLLLLAGAVLARTVARSAWKAPGQWLLLGQYALHSHLQKIPALFGQVHWHRARRRAAGVALVDYKDDAPTGQHAQNAQRGKRVLLTMLQPVARLWRRLVQDRWLRLWSAARLGEAMGRPLHPSNVVLGPVELHGTCRVSIGTGTLIYPGVYLETQGDGVIEIGDDVVLSRGVHIVAFDRVRLGAGTLVGEYSSLRDANHLRSAISVRHSGHVAEAIDIGRNVWIGRGVTVLKGVSLGDSSVVAANSVVTNNVAADAVVGGAPAQPLRVAPTAGPGEPALAPRTALIH